MPRGRAAKTIELEQACVIILAELQPVSVRAVAYQLFNRRLLPDMSLASTQRVSRVLTQARKRGVIPWHWIADESCDLESTPSWSDPDDYAKTVAKAYRRDRWSQQHFQAEIWSEKGTVRGSLKPVLDEFGIDFRVMHGFSSATVIHDVAERSWELHEPLQVLYVGDFDPSGLYMSEQDLPTRLDEYGAEVDLRRVALLPEDLVDPALQAALFPATAKRSDSRHSWFSEHHGGWCLELDALDPRVLRERVEDAISDLIDWGAWNHDAALEQVQLASLNEVLQGWAGKR